MGKTYHRPVLLGEVLEVLEVKAGEWYLDCTLGDGGHSLEILKKGGNVLGLDVDPEAIERTKGRLEGFGESGRFKAIQGNFRDIKNLVLQMDLADQKFAGILFDLGVSSLQLENPERGFSFGKVGPLDMRMDPTLAVTALDLVNGLNKGELYELFTKLGEEKYSRRLAEALVSAREVGPIQTTRQLAELAEKTLGRREKIHPATRIFQALRIAVNDELNALKEGLDQVMTLMEENGQILVISFHSLEDRIVKNTFNNWEEEGLGKVVTKKPITPSNLELRENPRSRSAKMRVFRML
ncbi:16S rRNA (cytosine(1402)-N(4))-methyltransferase RsmH [Candidatus Daviesbacteria bacterium]|nr:16S rRNA (cytosine(1402)-N(4))-methyltransferase RsmH [Candidatus Daviesbacteria bacterium]